MNFPLKSLFLLGSSWTHFSLFSFLLFSGCSTRSVLPTTDEVKVSRENPDEKCQDLGKVTGTSLSVKATPEEVLENMKHAAAEKGANYVLVKQYSSTGTSVTGIAYNCP